MRETLSTPIHRLSLTRLGHSDADELFALINCNREHLTLWGNTRTGYQDAETVGKYIAWSATPVRLLYGLRHDEELVGLIHAYRLLEQIVLGYWVSAPMTRRGFAKASIVTLVEYAWGEFGFTRFIADVDPQNLASRKTLRSCGFRFAGKSYLDSSHILYAKCMEND